VGNTLLHWFEEQTKESHHRPALREKRGGRWVTTTWGQWRETSRALASALVRLGVARGDRVALLSGTRQAFWEADIGVLLAGAVSVPLYPSLQGPRIAHMLADSGSVVLFAEDPLQVEKLAAAMLACPLPALRTIVLFEERAFRIGEDETERRTVDLVDLVLPGVEVVSLKALLEDGRASLPANEAELGGRLAAASPDDISTLMYTSGTLGEPKGAILTQRCFTSEIEALTGIVGLGPHDEQLLVLPMAHVFGRLLELAQLRAGYVTSFAETVWKVMDNIDEVNPTFVGFVPRFFEKFRAASQQRASRGGALRERAFRWSFDVGRKVAQRKREGRTIPPTLALSHAYADKLALSHVRAAFGTRFRFAVSGGAPLAKELGEWFEAAGVPVVEGYGLSETTAATHTNNPRAPRFGTVGQAIPGLEVRIAADGEILVRGPTVMRGYWNLPAATAEVLEADGFFHTGDIGTVDSQGYLTITDRKKEILVTAGGKNIAPQAVEAALRQSRFISRAAVFGDRRPYLVALLTLDESAARKWAHEHDREGDLGALAVDPELRAVILGEVAAANATLASFETVKRFSILPRELDGEMGELTPTLKVRRKAVFERHRALIDALYDEPAAETPTDVDGDDASSNGTTGRRRPLWARGRAAGERS
jgi:long-chain acyl-CoA synthetase